jgi:hypothetical protein
VFAREPETGKAHWAYQYSPHDLWDHSGVNENIVLDLPWHGKVRKVIIRPERNGYVYVLDRTSGEVLAADQYVANTVSNGVDLKTGRLRHKPEMIPQPGKVVRNVCPNAPGAKDWSPSAFSKVTGLLYVPHNNLCMDWLLGKPNYIRGTPYIGVTPRFFPGPGGNAGEFMAWDPVNRRKVWTIKERWPVWSGAAVNRLGDRLLRQSRRLVQSGRREHRQAALAVPDRLGDHRPADRLPRSRWTRICRDHLGDRRLDRLDGVARSRPARPDRRQGLGQYDRRAQEGDQQGRGHAVRVRLRRLSDLASTTTRSKQ